jgi:hypothetical protein
MAAKELRAGTQLPPVMLLLEERPIDGLVLAVHMPLVRTF